MDGRVENNYAWRELVRRLAAQDLVDFSKEIVFHLVHKWETIERIVGK